MRLDNFKDLKIRILEKFGNQEKFATAIGMSKVALSQRLNYKVDWKLNEIYKACDLLEIRYELIPDFFYAKKA